MALVTEVRTIIYDWQ